VQSKTPGSLLTPVNLQVAVLGVSWLSVAICDCDLSDKDSSSSYLIWIMHIETLNFRFCGGR
jgi:hypothetical protein